MNRFLLDVNVLIALIDPRHVRHDEAHRWFEGEGQSAWASCPLTLLGALRVVGSAAYPNSPGSLHAVAESLRSLCAIGDHQFWPDDLHVLDDAELDVERILQPAHLTDSYLLGLAVKRHGKLATFDRRLVPSAVLGGASSLHILA